MKSLRFKLLLISLFTQLIAHSQRLEVQEFIFEGWDCPDFISFDADFRERMASQLMKGLKSDLTIQEVAFGPTDGLTYRGFVEGWEAITPGEHRVVPRKETETDYFASVVFFFETTTAVHVEGLETVNLNFQTKVLVLDETGKKVYRESSSIPAQINPHCKTISDSWIKKQDFQQLMQVGIVDVFLNRRTKRKRRLLSCGRSFQLRERLARLDAFEVRKRRKQVSALTGDSTFYKLRLDLGGDDPEMTEWFFGWDPSETRKQEGILEDLTNGINYNVFVSMEATKQEIDSMGRIVIPEPAVIYSIEDKAAKKFYLLPSGSMKGFSGEGPLIVGIDADGLVNYYLNGEWVALSQYFPPDKNGAQRYSVDTFYHEEDLSDLQRELLVQALLAFDLGQAVYAYDRTD